LLEALGPAALRLDLGADPAAAADVHAYVLARVRGRDARMVPEVVADAIEVSADDSFLLARVLTSQLLAEPVDTSDPAWRDRLASSVESALHRDLERGEQRYRDGVALPQAATELLRALAYSYGPGFPAEDVWPAVATALSPSGSAYTRDDALWVLGAYGRYVTASSLSGQTVYRLHERLADVLRDGSRGSVARAVLDVYAAHLGHGLAAEAHPYLWPYAWWHAVDGENEGIAALDALAQLDPALRPGLASALNDLGVRHAEAGRSLEAVDAIERSTLALATLPDEDLPSLARALLNLGSVYGDVGRHTDAISPYERAARILTALAAEDDGFRHQLAMVLESLGVGYDQVGRTEEAVTTSERAVALFDILASEDPAGRPDLAKALDALGNRYSNAGRDAAALAATERAVALYAVLGADDPTLVPAYASALNHLGLRYSQGGRAVEALETAEHAVRLHEASLSPRPFRRHAFAVALNNLGLRYREAGRRDDAVRAGQRAVVLYEALAAENPVFAAGAANARATLARHSTVGLDERVSAWRSIETLAEARAFLLAHRDELLSADALALLAGRNDALGYAIARLTAEDAVDLAYAVLEDPDLGPAALTDARRGGSPATLRALAQLTMPSDAPSALVHFAIGAVLEGNVDAALEVLANLPEVPPDAIAHIGDAIEHRPDHAVGLARLIGALSSR
jgi:tetratricopeptide (TPR) repeat protein